ncbi:phage tail tape measure protein [Fusobacterium necrophorum]|uniref:Tail tape measure protein, TIGR01760 family n=6 Tax=Fusobacterium necrophorum TaxID=859 RepID=A0AAN3VXE1_9FUSO|nr:phage tail tape measure protein [Fusobacterium necrophorum]AYV94691.1 phage tail tape measure protein [Fusobacterium necrophorum subsp. funduliforme]EJU18751.1 tail tape measure protein, TIGR01760 family [Fusobacterium necrophorum subsp. funduliforme Fnf 1007]KYM52179.1 tail tape measure protein [Fusobacterium necrophorum subsp. funduliforme]KYM55319.1 tail tape measure protein [Fusobacterium necrophorum subsp. funduliforme]KYM58618.1 tail tape measure protein [Fusobacterium necrophorum sub
MIDNNMTMTVSLNDEASPEFKKMANRFGMSTNKFKKYLKDMMAKAKEMEREINKLDFKKLQENIKTLRQEAQTQLAEMKKSLESLKAKSKDVFLSIEKWTTRAVTAIVAYTTIAGKQFADLESNIKKVETISDDSFKKISKEVRNMAMASGTSSKELAGALYEIVSAVGDVPEKYKILEYSNKLAIAGFTDTTTAVDVLTTILNGYGMEMSEVNRVSDILIQTQNKGKIVVSELAQYMGPIISTAKLAKVSLEELAGAMATMTANGVKAPEASTYLKNMMNELIKTGTDADKAFKKIYGKSFLQFKEQGGTLQEALISLNESAKKSGMTLIDVFSSIRSSSGALVLANNMDKFIDSLKAMENASGTTDKAFQKMMNTFTQKFKQVKEILKEFGLRIFETIAPQIDKLMEKIKSIDVDKVFSQENIDKVVSFGKAIVTLGIALKGLKFANGFLEGLRILTGAEVKKDMLSVLKNGLGATRNNIKAQGLSVMSYFAKKTPEQMQLPGMGTSGTKTSMFAGLLTSFQGMIGKFKSLFAGGFTAALKSLGGVIGRIIPYILGSVKVFVALLGKLALIGAVVGAVILALKLLWDILSKNKNVTQVWGKVLTNLKEFISNIIYVGKQLYTFLLNTFTGDGVFGMVGKAIGSVASAIGSFVNWIIEAANKLLRKIGKEIEAVNLDYQNKQQNGASIEYWEQQQAALNPIVAKGKDKNVVPTEGNVADLANSAEDVAKKFREGFEKLMSEIGANITKEFTNEEKLAELEKAKGKYGKYIDEINRAINNVKLDILADKISYLSKGINIESMAKSFEQKKKDLEQMIEAQKEIIERKKIKGIDEYALKELEDQLKNMEYTLRKLPLDEQKEKLQEFAEAIEKMPIDEQISRYNALIPAIEGQIAIVEKMVNDGLLDEKFLKDYKKYLDEIKKKQQDVMAQGLTTWQKWGQGIQLLANTFSQLGSATGSKTMSGIGNVLGNVFSIGSALKNWGGMSSITGMFSGASGAFTAGMTSLGAIAGAVTGGIALVGTIGSLFGRSGKKKAAAIDARNKENEEAYKKQISALQQLTQAIQQNSERIKSFADRMLTDIAKNPTIKMIFGGESNFDLLHHSMIAGKHFADITAIEKGSKRYRSGFRKKSKSTYTKVDIGESELLRYLGFSKSELDAFTDGEMKQLDSVLHNVNHETLRRATGRNLTESSIEEWKKQVHEFVEQIKYLEKEKADLFKGSTLESFTGVEYKTEKELIKEYTEQFKQMGLVGEQYNETIKEMAKNNQVLITSMLDVRNSTIEGFASGNGGFLSSMKSYFEKIFKNASSVAYDVVFSDLDNYLTRAFEKISNKLVDIKKNGKLDFKGLFSDFDFEKLKNLDIMEKQVKQSLDVIKKELLSNGIDLSLINKMLPWSDFNDRINDLKNALSSAMNAGLEEHKFSSFTKALGQSLYDSVKNSLVKAFSESALYQGMIEKFIRAENFQAQLEKAGNFKDVLGIADGIMKKFSYELEAAGFGGFDAINNIRREEDTQLGNAYYTDKAANVNMTFNITHNGDVYGIEDLNGKIRRMWTECWEEQRKKPNGSN